LAVEATINGHLELTGLGETWMIPFTFSPPTVATKNCGYQQQATANSAEAIPLGGVTTASLVLIHAKTNSVDIDTSFDTSFSAEQTIAEGDYALISVPSGTLYFKNTTTDEQATIEYWILGSD